MAKKARKAFTIVELVIVIAVVAVLMAVLIPTFVSLVKKANVSADSQLVRNLNTILTAEGVTEGKNPTMHDALEDAFENGYDITKISPTSEGNDIVWDSKNDRFALVHINEDRTMETIYSDPATTLSTGVNLWRIYDKMPDTQTYSIYAGKNWTVETVDNLAVGFDAGENTGITEVKYLRSADATPQSVAIRTNSGTLTVNAPKDIVRHYGDAFEVDIEAVAGSSYHEFGSVDVEISIKEGHLVLENGSDVMFVNLNATSEAELANISVTLESGSSYSYVTTTNNELISQALGKIENKTGEDTIRTLVKIDDSTVAFIKKGDTITEYSDIKTALSAFGTEENAGATLELLDNIVNTDATSANVINIFMPANGTIDGHGKMIYGNVAIHVNSAGGSIYNTQFKYIHDNTPASQKDCDYYGWKSKEGTLTAISASDLTGTLVIDGCLFDNIDWDAIQTTPKSGATIEITNNVFMHSDKTAYSQLRYIHIQAGTKSTPATVHITGNKFYKTVNTKAAAITNIGCWYVSPSAQSDFTGNYFEYDPSSRMIETNSVVSTSGSFQQDGFRKLFPARDASGAEVNPAAFQKTEIAYMTLQDCINNAKATECIYLVHDNTSSVTIPEGASRNISLYGMKLGDLVNNGTLTFNTGSTTAGSANITNNGTLNLSCSEATGFKVVNNGVLNITYCSSSVAYNQSNITNNAGGQVKVTANNAYFTAPIDPEWTSWAGLAFYKSALQSNGYYAYVPYSDEEAMAEGAVVRSGIATYSARKYFTTLQDGVQKGAVYLLKDVSENVTRTDGNISFYGEDFTYTGSLSSSANVNIYNGTAILDSVNGVNLTFGSSQNKKGLTVTVKDGTVTGNITIYNNKTSGTTVVIEGGTYAGTITVKTGASLTIKGGTFSVDVSDYVDIGTHTITDNNDGTWTVTEKTN